jgi:hypothetical protein
MELGTRIPSGNFPGRRAVSGPVYEYGLRDEPALQMQSASRTTEKI